MINLTVVIDNDEALKKLKELQKVAKQTTSSVVDDSERMDEAFGKMGNAISDLVAGFAMEEFIRKMVTVRGEVQQLEVAFETMLGSKQKSDALMKEMIDLAAKTPFGLQDVTAGAKNLLAFGSTAEDVAEEITILGDIAAGLSIPLGDLIYLYGTTRTQGGLFTQDLKQFMGRGIPLADELAKVLGKTSNEVREMVSAGKIGFPEVQAALKGMTSEGGKFGGLMEKQSQTITGQISALEDAIYQMFNEIGESNEGVINSVLNGAGWMIEHYEVVLGLISKLVIAYGAYRAALMAYAAIQGALNLVAFTKSLWGVVRGVQSLTMAWRAMNTAMKSNAIGLIASIAATAIALIWDWVDGMNEAAEATEDTARVMGELEQAAHDEYIEVNKLAFRLKDANTSETERREILKQLKEINPSIVEGLNAEALAVETLTSNLEKYNFEQTKRVQLAAITDRQNEAASKYGEAELKKADLDLNLKKYVDQVIADYTTSGKLPEMSFTWTGEQGFREMIGQDNFTNQWEKNLRIRLENAIKRRSWGQIDDYEFLQTIGNLWEGATIKSATTGERPLSDVLSYDIKGIDVQARINNIEAAKKEMEDAANELKKETENSEYLLDAFGFLDKPTAGDDTGADANLDKAYKEAQKAWLDAKAAVAEANKNRANYTEEQYKGLVTQLDEAEKKFKSLGGDTSTKKDDSDKLAKETEKKAKDLSDALLKLERDLEQERINQLVEGGEKERAQIALNYQLREDEIKRQEDALKAQQGGVLTEEQTSQFAQLRAYSAAQRDKELGDVAAAERKAMNEYLAEYGEYQEKRLAIAELYAEKIAKATNEWERKGIEKERDKELADLDNTMSGKSNLFVRLFGDADKMNRSQLKAVIADTKQLINYLRGAKVEKPVGFTEEQLNNMKNDVEQIQGIYNELYEKQEELEKRNEYPFSNIINAFKLLSEAEELEVAAANEQNKAVKAGMLDTAAGLKMQANEMAIISASNAANTINSIADAFMRLSEATNNDSLKETAQSLGALGQNFAAAAEGAASGGWIGAIVGGVTDIISQAIEAFTSKKSEIYEFEQNRKDFLVEYQKLLVSLNKEDYESVFGANQLKRAADTREMLAELKRMYEEATQAELGLFEGAQSTITDENGETWYAIRPRDKKKFEEYVDAVKKEYNALEGMLVKTLDRSGFANLFGFKDEYTSLKDLAPELWGEDGLFNVEAARIFLETNTQITDEQRKQIENAIELSDKYNEALGEIDGMISDVFGNLSGDLTDIIFDSVRNGTDAWDEFGEKGSEIIDTLGKQMVQELFVQAYLDQYTEDLRNAFLSGDSNQIAEVTNRIFDNMGMMFDGASAAAAAWDANAEAMGFNMDGVGQEATARGFQAMPQDTGDELNGRFTDIQGKTTAINEAVQYIKSLSVSQLQQTTSISETLAQIHNDTSLIEKHTRELSLIREGIDRMNRNIENI